jgi:cobalt/nickel transport system permease protein
MHFSTILAPASMHIPDGFLSILVCIVFWLLSTGVVAVSLRKTGVTVMERQIPLMGVLGAAIFAGQMLNFSITGGTSGHLLGAALLTIVLGPWSAMLVMTAVVSLQALVFQDGGLLALGANIFNMAVIGVFVSYAVYRLLARLFKRQSSGLLASGFLAAWSSIFIASLAAALELAASGTSPANIAVPAMGGVHALIGIGEGLITVGALSLLYSARKDLLNGDKKYGADRSVLIAGGLIAIFLAILSPLASTHPDGLEWVAEQHGFLQKATGTVFNLIPEYSMPGITNPALATILAGILGVAIIWLAAFLGGRWARRDRFHTDA